LTITRGGRGAMRKGKGTRNEEQEGGEELQRQKSAVARTARGLERKEREWRMLS
jgi:hypothetical protein